MPPSKNYLINFSSWDGFFCVPQEIVDRHLKLASPNAIKILLYILRHGKTDINQQALAEKLSLPESAVADSLMYWCGAGILISSDSQNNLITAPTAKEPPVNSEPVKSTYNKSSAAPRPNYSSEDVAKALEKREDLKYLLSRAEEIFARPLSNSAIMTLFTLCDWEGISADIICMVMERCFNQNKLSMSNISNEARRWHNDGINTVADADRYIIELDERQSLYNKVKSAFGIGQRNFSKKERNFIDSWRKDFGYDIDMITIAFDTCVNAKGCMSFSYINSILSNWNADGVRTPEQAEERDRKFKQANKKSTAKKNVSYDLESEAKNAFSKFGQPKN